MEVAIGRGRALVAIIVMESEGKNRVFLALNRDHYVHPIIEVLSEIIAIYESEVGSQVERGLLAHGQAVAGRALGGSHTQVKVTVEVYGSRPDLSINIAPS